MVIQIFITFLWTRVVSWTSLDYTKTGKVIGYLIDIFHLSSASGTISNGIMTLYVNVPFLVHLEPSSYIRMCNLVHGSMLSLALRKRKNGKVLLNNRLIGVDNKMTLHMLMKHF